MLYDEPKVSIITPCYNGENYLEYFFKSLMAQTYKNVEFIFINDGSDDNSYKIYERYESEFIKKGWTPIYIYQENSGAASAINKGLKIFTGKYFIWPDCDDILYYNHIEEKVKFMEQNPEYGIAYSPFDIASIDNPEKIIGKHDFIPDDKMFSNIIERKNLIWTLGTIIRTKCFLDVNPERVIPECKGGQNCQIQMPILYKYPCGYINKTLSRYIVHQNSHSHKKKPFFKREIGYLEVWIKSIDMLKDMPEYKKIFYKLKVILRSIKPIAAHYFEYIFSVKSSVVNDKKYVIIYFFLIKITFKLRCPLQKVIKSKNFAK